MLWKIGIVTLEKWNNFVNPTVCALLDGLGIRALPFHDSIGHVQLSVAEILSNPCLNPTGRILVDDLIAHIMKYSTPDDSLAHLPSHMIVAFAQERRRLEFLKYTEAFASLDANGDGYLQDEEIKILWQEPKMMQSLGIPEHLICDAEDKFQDYVDEEAVTCDDFIYGMRGVKMVTPREMLYGKRNRKCERRSKLLVGTTCTTLATLDTIYESSRGSGLNESDESDEVIRVPASIA